MITSGLVSITFRDLTPATIIDLVVQAGQRAIEWGGDIHVPHGDLARAKEVGQATRDAGLELASYGSYYRLGHSAAEGLSFAAVGDTACALGCPAVRVWAGKRSLADVDEPYRQQVTAEAADLARQAAAAGLDLVFEFHARTLTESLESALRLLNQVAEPNVYTLWQPRHGVEPVVNAHELRQLHPRVYYAHVFHWWPDNKHRQPLDGGREAWRLYLAALRDGGRPARAMLEYVAGNEPEAYLQDAMVLDDLLNEVNGE